MACHLRSTSLPSTPHSNMIEVDKELHSLNGVISSPSATIEMICDGLKRLGDVYSCMDNIICLHSNQVQEKRLEEELEQHLELLDLCNVLQESFTDLKMSTQELQMVRKRGDSAAIQVKIRCYLRLTKKAKHHFKKVGNKSAFDKEDGGLAILSIKAREITILILKSALELLSKQIATCNASKWSLISKSFQKRKVSCEEAQLQALELDIAGLESVVQNLFRRLIQTRVSLLNTLSS